MTSIQKKRLEVESRRAAAEERKADALETMGESIKTFAEEVMPALLFNPAPTATPCRTADETQAGLLVEPSDRPVSDTDDAFPALDGNSLVSSAEAPSSSVPDRKKVVAMIREMRAQGVTYDFIARQLTEQNIPTFSGRGEWHAQTIHRLCRKK
jgi:hypothetical protein